MADNIHIASVADGAFENALGDLPPWATEDTALSIEGILRKTLNLQTTALTQLVKKATKGDNSIDAKETNDELAKLTKNLHDENAQRSKDKKYWNDENNQDKKNKKRWADEEGMSGRKLILEGLLVKAGLAIKGAFEDNKKTFDSLTESGINVMSGLEDAADGFTALRELTAITGVRFTELSASMQKYSSAVNSFGVGKFAKTVGMASANLTQFGYSSKESAELLGAMLSVQQGVSDVSQKTAIETNADLQRFGRSVSRLAIASGVAREKIIENAVAIGHSTDANLLAGQIGNKAAEGMTTFLASFKDQNIAKQILKLMSDPIKPLNESFMNLQKVGLGGFAQSFTQFTKTLEGMPEDVKQQALKSFIDAHKGELDREKQRLALLKQAGVAEAGAALDLVVGLQQQANAIKKLTPEEIKRLEASNEASKNLSNAFERFRSLLQRAFGPTAGMLNLFTTLLTGIIAPLEWVISLFDKIGETLSAFTGINMDLTPWIGLAAIGFALYKSVSIFKLAADFMAKTLFGIGKKRGVEGVTGKVAGSTAGKETILGGLGKGIGSIGKGIGDILSGLADGLKSLASPKVFIGIAALAGLAGVTFIMAKAFKEFNDVKWTDVTLGIVVIAGLAVGAAALVSIAPEIAITAVAIGLLGGAIWLLAKGLKEFPTNILPDMSESFGKLGNIIGSVFGGLLDIVSDVFTAIKDIVMPVIHGITAGFKLIGQIVSDVFKFIWSTISSVANDIGKVFNGVLSVIKSVFSGIWTVISSVFTSIDDIVSGVIGTITSTISGLGSILTAPFKWAGNIINSILSGISDTISTLINPIKWLSDKMGSLFSSSGPDSATKQLSNLSDSAQGLSPYAKTLDVINSSLTQMSSTLSSFTGLNKIKSIVDTINGVDTIKALALGAIASIGAVSLPAARPTSGPSASATPKSSTLNSPSAVSTDPAVGGDQSVGKEQSLPASTGTERGQANDGINTALGYQSSLLEQLLLSTNNLVSVNKDILKYARNSA
jgi:hypothetical protein